MHNKFLTFIFKKVSSKFFYGTVTKIGTNFSGKICVFHRGGGNKKLYRIIDFFGRLDTFGYLFNISYDPNRSAFVGLVLYDNGLFSNIILVDGLNIGNKIYSTDLSTNKDLVISKGSSFLLNDLNLFSVVSNIETRPFFGASLARSAGSCAVLISFLTKYAVLKLRSGWILKVSKNCMAYVGFISNPLHNVKVIGKAGKNRGLGKRPVVRGVAMNPCDHPHGGGNGKTPKPATPFTPWKKFAKWTHTKNKKADKLKRRLFKKVR